MVWITILIIIVCSLLLVLRNYRGYEQQEVTCNPNLRDGAAVWNVEDNRFPRRKEFWHFALLKRNNWKFYCFGYSAQRFVQRLQT
jgi:dolichyl-phosphate-mannose--protein O-mannosyl transferase